VEKVFHFDSPVEIYTADACVITCFDARFDLAVKKFLKRRGIALYDHVKIAGSAKPLADSLASGDAGCASIMNAVRTSMRLHQTSLVLIMSHNDCRAYPGVPADVWRPMPRAPRLSCGPPNRRSRWRATLPISTESTGFVRNRFRRGRYDYAVNR
jgi:hypothetical protein